MPCVGYAARKACRARCASRSPPAPIGLNARSSSRRRTAAPPRPRSSTRQPPAPSPCSVAASPSLASNQGRTGSGPYTCQRSRRRPGSSSNSGSTAAGPRGRAPPTPFTTTRSRPSARAWTRGPASRAISTRSASRRAQPTSSRCSACRRRSSTTSPWSPTTPGRPRAHGSIWWKRPPPGSSSPVPSPGVSASGVPTSAITWRTSAKPSTPPASGSSTATAPSPTSRCRART